MGRPPRISPKLPKAPQISPNLLPVLPSSVAASEFRHTRAGTPQNHPARRQHGETGGPCSHWMPGPITGRFHRVPCFSLLRRVGTRILWVECARCGVGVKSAGRGGRGGGRPGGGAVFCLLGDGASARRPPAGMHRPSPERARVQRLGLRRRGCALCPESQSRRRRACIGRAPESAAAAIDQRPGPAGRPRWLWLHSSRPRASVPIKHWQRRGIARQTVRARREGMPASVRHCPRPRGHSARKSWPGSRARSGAAGGARGGGGAPGLPLRMGPKGRRASDRRPRAPPGPAPLAVPFASAFACARDSEAAPTLQSCLRPHAAAGRFACQCVRDSEAAPTPRSRARRIPACGIAARVPAPPVRGAGRPAAVIRCLSSAPTAACCSRLPASSGQAPLPQCAGWEPVRGGAARRGAAKRPDRACALVVREGADCARGR